MIAKSYRRPSPNRPARRLSVALLATAVCATSVACPPLAHAGEIVFKNGDRLTGTVVSAVGGKLKFKTVAAGEITVDLATVETFSTDAPVDIVLSDGSVLKQKVDRTDLPSTAPVGTTTSAPVNTGPAVRTSGGIIGEQVVPLSAVSAINPPPPAVPKWTGAVKASAEMSRGNSYTDSFDLAFDATRRGEKDRRFVSAGYSFSRGRAGSGDKNVTEDEWFATAKYDYFLSKKVYLFGLTRIEKDRIADLDFRFAPSAGVGYQFVERPDFNVRGELGAGWLYEDYDGADDAEDHFTARAAYHIDRTTKDGKIKFFHDLEYLPSIERADDFNVNARAGVRFRVTRKFFTEFAVEWQYDATPAPDASKNDAKYKAAIGWEF